MKLKLDTQLSLPNKKINFLADLVFIGSCFSENISDKFSAHYINAFKNPNGIVYNPISISEQIINSISQKTYTEEDVFFHNDQWHSFDFHSLFSALDKNTFLEKINLQTSLFLEKIKKANFLFISFGSAFVYNYKGKTVSNCHKLSGNFFNKELLSKEDILGSFKKTIQLLDKLNPNLQIVFSISPVRYIRDGIVENNLSKAILIQSVHEIISEHKNCQYFPAYEIIIDELRDYRFFKEDFIHPNELAINFVWEKIKHWMDDETIMFLNEVSKYNQFKNHRLINPAKEVQHQQEVEIKKIQLKQKYPTIKFS